jgi:hypothetical protein
VSTPHQNVLNHPKHTFRVDHFQSRVPPPC